LGRRLKKGGKVKCSPKKKGDKKKVMGTVGEAKAINGRFAESPSSCDPDAGNPHGWPWHGSSDGSADGPSDEEWRQVYEESRWQT
jgi:hypothetical protein